MQPIGELKKAVGDLIAIRHPRLTPKDVIRSLRERYPQHDAHSIRLAVRSLLEEGTIRYSQRFSISYLEPAFQGAADVTPRLSLRHATSRLKESSANPVVTLMPGAAFGMGDHPTTRLALNALDWVMKQMAVEVPVGQIRVLDIGTGSGVLAIAAVLLGAASALAIDTDALSCVEALQNVGLNGLQGRIKIVNDTLESLYIEPYDIIMANLRPPTLKTLFPIMSRFSSDKACWVLSGFRFGNVRSLFESIDLNAKRLVWSGEENQWSAMVVTVKDSTS